MTFPFLFQLLLYSKELFAVKSTFQKYIFAKIREIKFEYPEAAKTFQTKVKTQ